MSCIPLAPTVAPVSGKLGSCGFPVVAENDRLVSSLFVMPDLIGAFSIRYDMSRVREALIELELGRNHGKTGIRAKAALARFSSRTCWAPRCLGTNGGFFN